MMRNQNIGSRLHSSFGSFGNGSCCLSWSVTLTLLAIVLLCDAISGLSVPPARCFAEASSSSSSRTRVGYMDGKTHSLESIVSTPVIPRQVSISADPHNGTEDEKEWKRRTSRVVKYAVKTLFPRKSEYDDHDYERRKREWAAKYTKVESLREMFGENENKLWGDLDNATSRRLYKTLLPRVLLELYKVGIRAEDLAPLAYSARVAAKFYARERCVLPGRLAASLYDGYRQWLQYGKFQTEGMSYDQVWAKYARRILDESKDSEDALTEDDVVTKICLKILESSCKTNDRIDRLILQGYDFESEEDKEEQARDLETITEKLEREVREILNKENRKGRNSETTLGVHRVQTLRLVARAKRRLERMRPERGD